MLKSIKAYSDWIWTSRAPVLFWNIYEYFTAASHLRCHYLEFEVDILRTLGWNSEFGKRVIWWSIFKKVNRFRKWIAVYNPILLLYQGSPSLSVKKSRRSECSYSSRWQLKACWYKKSRDIKKKNFLAQLIIKYQMSCINFSEFIELRSEVEMYRLYCGDFISKESWKC
jgi:hypothetical protein